MFLLSMVVVLIMGHSVPFAFEGRGHWIAFGYLIHRVIGISLAVRGTQADAVQAAAMRKFAPTSLVGPIVIVIGSFMGDSQAWWWLAGWLIELASSTIVDRMEFNINAEHFAERHGLIMIIAFGESIVVIGSAITDTDPSWEVAGVLTVGILGAIALWWAYFDRMEELWEWALIRADSREKGRLARDVYSMLHYPMLLGVVLYAVAAEEIFRRPGAPILGMVRVTLGLSLLFFLLPIVAATWRSVKVFQFERFIAAIVIAGFVFSSGEMTGRSVLLITTVLLLVAMTAEYWRFRARIREGKPASTAGAQ